MITDREKLRRAFLDLRSIGFVAAMDFWCCSTCANYELMHPDSGLPPERFVYWHTQNDEAFDDHDPQRDMGEYEENALHSLDTPFHTGMLRGTLYLHWHGSLTDAETVVAVLRRHHLLASWPGTADRCVEVRAYGHEED